MSTIEENVEQEDYSSNTNCISSLPNEVLINIFTLLPLKDRKIVRLVCTQWYACCTCLSISKNEKFVFRTGISVHDIAKVMVDSNLPSLNLEFQGLPISSLLAYTWKACGHKIETLEFYECQWNDKTIRNIITYCTKLKSFTMKSPIAVTNKHNLGNILCSPHLLDELARKGIRRTELHTFTMFVDDVHLPESILRKIFLIYPCIRHFSTGTYQDSFSYCLILHVGEQPKFSRLDKCLTNSVNYAQFESLSFNLPTDGSWMEIFTAKAPEQEFRLKNFKTMLIYKESTKATLLKFFSSQKNLTVVELGLAQCDHSFLKKIVFHILESCPNLREFHLKLIDPFCLFIESKEFPRFIDLISKLKVLILNFNVCPNNNPDKIFQEAFKSFAQKNFALTTLRLDETNDKLCRAILKHCPLLEHLKLSLCTDDTLQVIFKNLLKLQTLVLGDVDDCTDYGFTGCRSPSSMGYSIKRLTQLRHLDIRGFDADLSEIFVLELQLPRLEFLSLNLGIYPQLSIDTLIRLASYVPELRVLCVDQVQGQTLVKKTHQFCKHLNNLYHLICIETEYDMLDCKTECFEAIFEECTSLRFISDAEYHILMFNPFTGKVLHKNLDSVKFQGSVFDDGLFC